MQARERVVVILPRNRVLGSPARMIGPSKSARPAPSTGSLRQQWRHHNIRTALPNNSTLGLGLFGHPVLYMFTVLTHHPAAPFFLCTFFRDSIAPKSLRYG